MTTYDVRYLALKHKTRNTTETTSNNNNISIVDHTSDDELQLTYDRYEKLFRCGDTAYVEERYNDAIQLYSTVLQQDTATLLAAAAASMVPRTMVSLSRKSINATVHSPSHKQAR